MIEGLRSTPIPGRKRGNYEKRGRREKETGNRSGMGTGRASENAEGRCSLAEHAKIAEKAGPDRRSGNPGNWDRDGMTRLRASPHP